MFSAGAIKSIPQAVAELGPADSLGMGLCSLLSGARSYYAFDAIKHAASDNNLRIFLRSSSSFSQCEPTFPTERNFPC
jgi:hypothetical protein